MSSARPSKFRRIVFAAAATLLLLSAAEGLVRLGGWADLPVERFFTSAYDPQYGLRAKALNPYAKAQEFLNENGFRGPALPAAKAPGVWRIVSAGDSVCFGFGVDEDQTYTRRLDAELRRRGESVETLNAGIPGTTLWQQRALLEKRLPAWRPDLLILYTQPSYRADHYVWREVQNGRRLSVPPVRAGLSHLHVYRLLRRWLRPPRFDEIVSQYYADRRGNAPLNLVFRQAHDDLVAIRDLCARGGTKLLVVPVLAREFFDAARAAAAAPGRPNWEEFLARHDGVRPFKRDLQELNIPILDATAAFAAGDPAALFLDDCHFTAAGHALLARLLVDNLGPKFRD
jgi:hypothetical protein